MVSRLRVIVTGLIAQYALGGLSWHYLHYLLGLARLGHDVYYIEDTELWPYDHSVGGGGKDCRTNVEYLARVMARFGLENRWAYRFDYESRWFGLADDKRQDVIRNADLMINVSGTIARPEKYRGARRLAFIDTDPVFTQIKLAQPQPDFCRKVEAHDVLFSFGECLGAVPDTGHDWKPTRQPITLSQWGNSSPPRDVFTTVMNWTSYNDVVYEGRRFGQKDREFKRFLDLPGKVAPTALELAIASGKTRRTPVDMLRRKNWLLVDPAERCSNIDNYRQYIQSSKAEFSVSKHAYVAGDSGWFSERSACYLASGRPVVLQDTGYSRVLPTGEGLLAFRDEAEAVAAIRGIEADYERHSRAALEIAREYFDSDRVLGRLIDEAM